MTETKPHIGTLKEKPLHSSLKRWYARPGDRVEVPIDGFVIDLVRDDLLIEIQTRGFSSMKKKIAALLDGGRQVRIVHSIPIDKWIVKLDSDGVISSRRRSPKHGAPSDIFSELVSIVGLLDHPFLEIEVLMTTEEELRIHTPDRAWRRKGWVIVERRLIEVVESLPLQDIDDLKALLPDDLPDAFTTAVLAERLGRPRRAAQQMTYCLRKTGALVAIGKQGNSVEYRLG